MRYVTPLLFFLCAAWVHHANGQSTGSVLVFPFLESLVPSLKGDPAALGRATEGLLVALGGVLLLVALVRSWMSRSDDD